MMGEVGDVYVTSIKRNGPVCNALLGRVLGPDLQGQLHRNHSTGATSICPRTLGLLSAHTIQSMGTSPQRAFNLPSTSSETRSILVACGLELLSLHNLAPTADKSIRAVCKSKALFT